MNNDGCFSVDGALIFADATAGAFLLFHDRAFLIITNDCLVRALLITDEADLFCVPCDASCLIDMGDSQLQKALFLDGDRSDRLRGTHPATKIAEFYTVADPRDQPWSIKTCEPRLQKGRLEGIVGADLQTLTTPRANGDEFFLWKRTRRPNETVVD